MNSGYSYHVPFKFNNLKHNDRSLLYIEAIVVHVLLTPIKFTNEKIKSFIQRRRKILDFSNSKTKKTATK